MSERDQKNGISVNISQTESHFRKARFENYIIFKSSLNLVSSISNLSRANFLNLSRSRTKSYVNSIGMESKPPLRPAFTT